ncbi:MAG TPA: DUF5658 family protein [Vicinamibacterales bacterium]|nr:DUF5658 family protein [Vicinamibacterales bacterium]
MFATARHASALAFTGAVLLASASPAAADDRINDRPLPQVQFTLGAVNATFVPWMPSATPTIPPALLADITPEPKAEPLAESAQRPVDLAIPRSEGSAATSLRRSMYVSFAALQVMDAVSTRKALAAGGREANPAMTGIVKNNAALYAVKAGTAVVTTYFAERLAKHHPRRAMVLMVVLNGAYAAIVAHNYRVARNQ